MFESLGNYMSSFFGYDNVEQNVEQPTYAHVVLGLFSEFAPGVTLDSIGLPSGYVTIDGIGDPFYSGADYFCDHKPRVERGSHHLCGSSCRTDFFTEHMQSFLPGKIDHLHRFNEVGSYGGYDENTPISHFADLGFSRYPIKQNYKEANSGNSLTHHYIASMDASKNFAGQNIRIASFDLHNKDDFVYDELQKDDLLEQIHNGLNAHLQKLYSGLYARRAGVSYDEAQEILKIDIKKENDQYLIFFADKKVGFVDIVSSNDDSLQRFYDHIEKDNTKYTEGFIDVSKW